MSRAVRFAPLLVLAVIVVALVWRLATPADTNVHSTLAGKPVPAFAATPAEPGKPAFASAELANGSPHLVNFFASWCVPCITEVGVLRQLEGKGVGIYGIAVRDKPDELADFLARSGDPYRAITSDPESKLQIGFGSSGVPESFVVDGKGIIRYQHIGPIEQDDIHQILALPTEPDANDLAGSGVTSVTGSFDRLDDPAIRNDSPRLVGGEAGHRRRIVDANDGSRRRSQKRKGKNGFDRHHHHGLAPHA